MDSSTAKRFDHSKEQLNKDLVWSIAWTFFGVIVDDLLSRFNLVINPHRLRT